MLKGVVLSFLFYTKHCAADDLMDLLAGDLDSLTDLFQGLFSPAVSHFLHSLPEKRPDKERKMLPALADVHALPACGLGRLMVSLTILKKHIFSLIADCCPSCKVLLCKYVCC